MLQKNREARKQLLVDNQLQGAIIRAAIVHWMVFTAAVFALALIVQFCLDPFAGFGTTLRLTARTFAPVLLALLTLTPVFVMDLLRVSNRAFGPLLRVRRTLQDMAGGRAVTPLAQRASDGPHELVDTLNELIELTQSARDSTSSRESATPRDAGDPQDGSQDFVTSDVHDPAAIEAKPRVSINPPAR